MLLGLCPGYLYATALDDNMGAADGPVPFKEMTLLGPTHAQSLGFAVSRAAPPSSERTAGLRGAREKLGKHRAV